MKGKVKEMGKVAKQVEERAKKASDIQESYMNTLHWCITALDDAIRELVDARTNILNATKETLTDLKKQAEEI